MARAVAKLYLMIMTTSAVMSSSPMPPPVVAEAGVVIEEFGTGVEEKRIPRQVGDGISLLRLSAGSVSLSMQIEEKSFETKLSGSTLVTLPPHARLTILLPPGSALSLVRIPLGGWAEAEYGWGRPPAGAEFSPSIIRAREHGLVRFCDALLEEHREPGLASAQVIEALSRLIGVEFFRHLATDAQSSQWTPLTPRQLRSIEEHVEAHLQREISLQELADLLRYSPHYFCRVFKRATGISPHQFVLSRRIERAKVLLRNRELSLSNLALEVGFANQSHFGATFRKVVGVTPHRFRMMLRGAGAA